MASESYASPATVEMEYAREAAAGQPVISPGLERFVEDAQGLLDAPFKDVIGSKSRLIPHNSYWFEKWSVTSLTRIRLHPLREHLQTFPPSLFCFIFPLLASPLVHRHIQTLIFDCERPLWSQSHSLNMRELFSHLGFGLYLFELQGSLKYTHTRNGKAPKVYEICESDIEDGDDSDTCSTEDTTKLRSGIEASAVGIRLRLVKNHGLLRILFEGKDGAAAEWRFDGMELLGGGSMVATAATQTDVGEEKCVVCGKEEKQIIEVKHEETQTDTAAMQSTETQTIAPTTDSLVVQVTSPRVALQRHILGVVEALGPFIDTPAAQRLVHSALSGLGANMRDARTVFKQNVACRQDIALLRQELRKLTASRMKPVKPGTRGHPTKPAKSGMHVKKTPSACTSKGSQTDSSGDIGTQPLHDRQTLVEDNDLAHPDLKRHASSTPIATAPLHKRAKSIQNSPAWPRHLYMACFRSYPIFKGDVGTLHIDVKEATVWFEGWHGKPHARIFERKQIDLRDPNTRVICKHFKVNRLAADNARYTLEISRPNAKLEAVRILEAHLCAPKWEQAWGSDGSDRTKLPIVNPRVMIDALVHCIDVTSRRDAIHSPEVMNKLHEDIAQYTKFQDARSLTSSDMLNWEFTLKELEKRERRREVLVLCEMPDFEGKNEDSRVVDAKARERTVVDPMDEDEDEDEDEADGNDSGTSRSHKSVDAGTGEFLIRGTYRLLHYVKGACLGH